MRYSEETIEQVRNANDIVDVIGQYVRLTKKGSSYFGLCPFHGEKTASFSVSPQKQIYYCFGCGAGGNVITFLMEYENYTFTEALKALADRAHIALPEASEHGESRAQSELKEKLFEINKTAALYFYEQLKSEAGQAGYAYFKGKRRLSDATITHFGLGFARKSPDALYRYLQQKGYSDELISESGLALIEERGARDKFWNRVMFPIMDAGNRVVGFGGRVLGDGMPKYLNSPETKIFDKSRNLYGLNFARRSRRDYFLLCEGYMDVIALHQAGFTNAVASLGTAFNEKHAQLLKRYTKTVVLTQDNDEAGVRAKLRAFHILREAGFNVKVLDTSDSGYKDPDEFLQHLGPDEFESYIRKAKNAFLFEIETIKKKYRFADPAEVTAFYNETAEKLCIFTEELERNNYVRAVSNEQQIPYEELRTLVERKLLKLGGRTAPQTRYDPDKAYRQSKQEAQEAAERERGAQGAGGQAFETTKRSGPAFSERNPAKGREPGQTAANSGGAAAFSGRGSAASGSGPAVGRQRLSAKMPNDTALLKSERLLLSWFCARPGLIRKAAEYLSAADFSEGIYREIAEEIFAHGTDGGAVSPAAIMDRYANNEAYRKQIGAIFGEDAAHKSIEEMSESDFEKAVTEAVRNLKRAALEKEIAAAGTADLLKLQKLLNEKNALFKLRITLGEN